MKFLKNILKIYRITDWFYYLGYILIGFSLRNSLSLDVFNYLFLGAFLLAYAYSFNDYCDGHQKRTFFILPLFLTFLIIIFIHVGQIIISLFFLVLVTIYSVKPIRLKSKPFISSLLNGIGFSLLFFLGYFHGPGINFDILIAIILFSFGMVAQFIHEVVDLKNDKKKDIITTAVFCGEKTIKKFCHTFFLFNLAISLYLFYMRVINLLFLVITILFVVFFIIEISKEKINIKLRKKYKICGMITGLIYLVSILI